jgi:HK97 family phage major capsid protein
MAVTAATMTGDFSGFLPATIAGPIFERAARQSVVQRLVRQIPLGGNGVSVPVVTGRPAAGWVDEGAAKPATAGSLALKSMTPKKLGAILVVSSEVVRANPGNYINTMRESLAEAFAVSFDRAALHDEGPDGTAGGGPFATYVDQATKVQEVGGTTAANGGVFVDLVEAMRDIVSDTDASGRRYQLTGWALDSVLEPSLWGAVDTTGRPIFVDLPVDAESAALGMGAARLLGRPSFMGEGVASGNQTAVVGYGGDWTQAAWGVVGGITYDVSTEATVTINGALTSLWEHNLMAIRAEAEYGFLVNDVDAFTKLTNIGNVPITST